jgi:hypothetical protein
LEAELPVYAYTPTTEVVRPPFVLTNERDLIRVGLDGSQRLEAAPFGWAAAPAVTTTAATPNPVPGAAVSAATAAPTAAR